jgi:hypothetical protein
MPALFLVQAPITSVHLDHGGFVTITIRKRSWGLRVLRPTSGKSLHMNEYGTMG